MCDNPADDLGESCGTCPADCGPCQPFGDIRTCTANNKWALTIDDGPSPLSSAMLANIAATGEHVRGLVRMLAFVVTFVACFDASTYLGGTVCMYDVT